MRTLNQIKATLTAVAASHKQIGSYGDGREWDIEANGAKSPSVMWSVLKTATLADKEITINYDLFFLDMVRPDESNVDDVMSDQLLIATDVITLLESDDYTDEFFAKASTTIEPAFEEFDNTWYGWHVEIGFRMPFVKDECAVPIN